jgi:hypothetical protein
MFPDPSQPSYRDVTHPSGGTSDDIPTVAHPARGHYLFSIFRDLVADLGRELWLILACIAFVVLLAIWGLRWLTAALYAILHGANSLPEKIEGLLAIALLALLLFGLRKWHRFYYGGIELIFGLYSTWKTFGQADPERMFVSLGAGVYLIVRAFDNMNEGIKARRKQAAETLKRRSTGVAEPTGPN